MSRFVAPVLVGVALVVAARDAGATRFRWPVDDPGATHILLGMVIGYDHDPVERGDGGIHCLDATCRVDFPWCYDGHEGTDFPLDGGFDAMDAGSLPVVAAASGEVVQAEDGNYDRCHGELATGEVNCDGHPMRANLVRIRHADGMESGYYHLRSGTVAVEVGDVVECGAFLGLMGSSGRSALPHLHFQVWDAGGVAVDPYPGACGGGESLWVQEDGPGGMPWPLCEGESLPVEAGPEEEPEPAPELLADTGPAPEPVPEAPGGDALGQADARGGLWSAGGCAAGPVAGPSGSVALLALFALAAARMRRRL